MVGRTLLVALAVPFALVFGLCVGGTPLATRALAVALAHPRAHDDAAVIVWAIRLPRVVIAATVGASLAMVGTVMQALLRNPLVDPYLIGVSSGAGAAIAIAATLGASVVAAPGYGFVAGLATAIVVAVLARRGSGIDGERLILAGVSISALTSALTTLALTRLARGNAAEAIIAWLAGSIAGRGWVDLLAALPYALAGTVGCVAMIPSLDILRVGERRALALGLEFARVQWIVLAAAALLTAAAVTLAGLVGFVGLIVPHLARRIGGTDLRRAFPLAAMLGATLVVIADAASRAIVAPAEIPLGVLLAFVGVPAFLFLYLRGATQP